MVQEDERVYILLRLNEWQNLVGVLARELGGVGYLAAGGVEPFGGLAVELVGVEIRGLTRRSVHRQRRLPGPCLTNVLTADATFLLPSRNYPPFAPSAPQVRRLGYHRGR